MADQAPICLKVKETTRGLAGPLRISLSVDVSCAALIFSALVLRDFDSAGAAMNSTDRLKKRTANSEAQRGRYENFPG